MERFVRLIVGGGLALVAGLWLERLFAVASGPWLAGIALVAVGAGTLAAGIRLPLDV